MKIVTCFAPASVANVGPFYDVMGYCLNNLGDFIEARETSAHKEFRLIDVQGPYAKDLQAVSLDKNVVYFVARQIREDLEDERATVPGIDLILHKYMPVGTGLGSSGASVVAATKAILTMLGRDRNTAQEKILDYLVAGETQTANQPYPDNVAPSYFGGFNVISRDAMRPIAVRDFYSLILLQSSLETREQRKLIDQHFFDLLAPEISIEEKVQAVLTISRFQAREACILIDALRDGKLDVAGRVISQIPKLGHQQTPAHRLNDVPIELNGHCISTDPGNYVELVRGRTIPNYCAIKTALLDAGAHGVGISGSGPALFALASDETAARAIKDKTLKRLQDDHLGNFRWLISNVNQNGASVITDGIKQFVSNARGSHNFWEEAQ